MAVIFVGMCVSVRPPCHMVLSIEPDCNSHSHERLDTQSGGQSPLVVSLHICRRVGSFLVMYSNQYMQVYSFLLQCPSFSVYSTRMTNHEQKSQPKLSEDGNSESSEMHSQRLGVAVPDIESLLREPTS